MAMRRGSRLLVLSALLAQEPEPPTPAPAPAFVPMPIPRSVVPPRRERPLRIDADLSDWPEVPVLFLNDPRQLSGTAMGAWRGEKDLSAQAYLLWDEEHLYFAANVMDDWPRPLPSRRPEVLGHFELPPADGIVLTFDPDRDTQALGDDPGREEDAEFWIGLEETGRSLLVRWDRYRGRAEHSKGKAAILYDRERGLYVYEARIPWSEILPEGRKPEPGMAIGCNVVVNDLDDATDPLPQTRVGWNFGMGPAIHPGLLGTLILSSRPVPPGAKLPEPPPRPEPPRDPVPPPRFWIGFLRELEELPPVVAPAGGDPAEALGEGRLGKLRFLDDRLQRFPRVDFFEMVARAQRRQQRELAGIMATGTPHLFMLLGEREAREGGRAPRGPEIQRLWPGGWLVRSPQGSFAIDPQGPAAEVLSPHVDFAAFTDSSDTTRTLAPFIHRVLARDRRVLAHRSFHLPAVPPENLPLVRPGDELEVGELSVRVLGDISEEGLVTSTVGYRVAWPDGRVLVHAALSLKPQDLGSFPRVDWLILPLHHPHAEELVRELKPSLVLPDGLLDFHRAPPDADLARIPLEEGLERLRALAPPTRHALLSWGETLRLVE